MWKCIFSKETNIGVAFNRDPLDEEYKKMIPAKLCGDFNNTPERYMYLSGELIERDGWQEDKEQKSLEAWRASMSCGPLQFRRALRAFDLLKDVKEYLKGAEEEIVEAWEYATKINRNDPFVLSVQKLLGKTEEDLDKLFKLAVTYP